MSRVPQFAVDKLMSCVEKTANDTGLTLTLAISYSSHEEITKAVRNIAEDAKNGKININEIDDKTISDYLFTSGMPNPDLLIRTGGECRISNYLLWQIAYAELHFANVLWPDFSKEEFCNIIFQYQSRERRFGKTSEQIKSKQ